MISTRNYDLRKQKSENWNNNMKESANKKRNIKLLKRM